MDQQLMRTKSVTTKVTEAECKRLEETAGECGVNLSEWVRGKLLGAERTGSEARVLLGEVLALRAILINLLFSISQGKTVTPESMQQMIEKAEGEKLKRALERLTNSAQPEGA